MKEVKKHCNAFMDVHDIVVRTITTACESDSHLLRRKMKGFFKLISIPLHMSFTHVNWIRTQNKHYSCVIKTYVIQLHM